MSDLLAAIAAKIQKDSHCSDADAKKEAAFVADLSAPFVYVPWRHGGWYVHNVRYRSGAVGCVSRNYPDKKWRIACGRPYEETFPDRDSAARAEQLIALAEYLPRRILPPPPIEPRYPGPKPLPRPT